MPPKLELLCDGPIGDNAIILINGFRLHLNHPGSNNGFDLTLLRDLKEIQRQLALVPVLQREIRRLKRQVKKK